jgi:hypothetical protein
MSLLGYQQAFCDMVASPEMCVRVRANAAEALSPYDITLKERGRLAAIAGQRGMSTSCTLHRLNRMTPIYSYLPLTCTLLGDNLMREAERFWSECRLEDLQFKPETRRFATFLQRRIADGVLDDPRMDDVLRLELAALDLQWQTEPRARLVRFRNDPEPLLRDLSEGRQPPRAAETAEQDYFVMIDTRGGEIRLSVIEGAVPDDIARLTGGVPPHRDCR